MSSPSSHSTWRLDVARRAAAVYAENPKVAVVVAAGSVGAGTADEWSDLELDLYWHAPPGDDERRRPIERLGGRVERFWPFSEHEEEWGEEYSLDGLGVGISSFTVDTAQRFLHRVTVDGDPATPAQMRVAAGWFDRNWQVDEGLVFPGNAEVRAKSAVLQPDRVIAPIRHTTRTGGHRGDTALARHRPTGSAPPGVG